MSNEAAISTQEVTNTWLITKLEEILDAPRILIKSAYTPLMRFVMSCGGDE
jgi:hypothetical protein